MIPFRWGPDTWKLGISYFLKISHDWLNFHQSDVLILHMIFTLHNLQLMLKISLWFYDSIFVSTFWTTISVKIFLSCQNIVLVYYCYAISNIGPPEVSLFVQIVMIQAELAPSKLTLGPWIPFIEHLQKIKQKMMNKTCKSQGSTDQHECAKWYNLIWGYCGHYILYLSLDTIVVCSSESIEAMKKVTLAVALQKTLRWWKKFNCKNR